MKLTVPHAGARVSVATHATLFSHVDFCRAWAETFGLRWERLDGSDDLGLVFSRSRRLGFRDYKLAPRGLYWGAEGEEAEPTAQAALAHCRSRRRCLGLTWNFRYDARRTLDSVVRALGADACSVVDAYSHVLDIDGASIEEILARRVRAVTRRQVRQSAERGLAVRGIDTPQGFDAHDALYRAWALRRGAEAHPASLFPGLVAALGPRVVLLGAYREDELVAAMLVFRGGQEWFYWHGVRDPELDRDFAMDALLARAVSDASRAGARYLNLGASSGNASIEWFKERWGATPRPVWSLRWSNPRWAPVLAGWQRIRGQGRGGNAGGTGIGSA